MVYAQDNVLIFRDVESGKEETPHQIVLKNRIKAIASINERCLVVGDTEGLISILNVGLRGEKDGDDKMGGLINNFNK